VRFDCSPQNPQLSYGGFGVQSTVENNGMTAVSWLIDLIFLKRNVLPMLNNIFFKPISAALILSQQWLILAGQYWQIGLKFKSANIGWLQQWRSQGFQSGGGG
jgi:hypothetical protein